MATKPRFSDRICSWFTSPFTSMATKTTKKPTSKATASRKAASSRKPKAAPKAARDTRSEYWENKAKQEKAASSTSTKKRSTGAKRATTVKAASKKATTTKRKVTALPTKSIRQPRYYMVALDKTNGTPVEKGRDYMTLKELAIAETALRHKGARVFKKSMYTSGGTLADCPKCR